MIKNNNFYMFTRNHKGEENYAVRQILFKEQDYMLYIFVGASLLKGGPIVALSTNKKLLDSKFYTYDEVEAQLKAGKKLGSWRIDTLAEEWNNSVYSGKISYALLALTEKYKRKYIRTTKEIIDDAIRSERIGGDFNTLDAHLKAKILLKLKQISTELRLSGANKKEEKEIIAEAKRELQEIKDFDRETQEEVETNKGNVEV